MSLRFTTQKITSFHVTDNQTGDQAQFTESQWTTAQILTTTHPSATARTANATFLAQLFDIPSRSAELLFEANAELLELNGLTL